MADNLVYYSLVNQAPHAEQWIQSVRSLRTYNHTIPVHLFLYNGVGNDSIRREAYRQNVVVHDLGDYEASFAGYGPRRHAFAYYRTLHKFRSLKRLPPANQVLYIDCDTFFFIDVERLFGAYRAAHFYAREEVMTRRNHFGYNPNWVDEDVLAKLATSHHAQMVTPCNTGVCMMNYGIWINIAELYDRFLDFAWRLLVSAHVKLDLRLPAITQHFSAHDYAVAATEPYPTSSAWIFEEVAMWLMLGTIEGLKEDVFAASHVMQGSECDGGHAWLAHYWTNREVKFFEKIDKLL